MPESYSNRLQQAFAVSQLCVGIDPHGELLEDNGFPDSVTGLRDFSMKLLDQLEGQVAIVKPQVSFFERFGSKGFAVLEDLLSEASKRKFFVIADAKRGDIGSTMNAYTDAWLAKSAPFICDALTVSPYLGVGSLEETLALAIEREKGLFVLCATSNPEGEQTQKAVIGGKTIARQIQDRARTLNTVASNSKAAFGHLGLVIGATVNLPDFGLDASSEEGSRTPVLAPGFGFQGAQLGDIKRIFPNQYESVIATISRSALRDGINNVSRAVAADKFALAEALAK